MTPTTLGRHFHEARIMRVLLSAPAMTGLLALVSSLPLFSGCRSTRENIASVPGMGWMASKEADWADEDPDLPPPSSEATPQLSSDGGQVRAKSQGKAPSSRSPAVDAEYPDTGYTSPYSDAGDGRLVGGSRRQATEDRDQGHMPADPGVDRVSEATVGQTQNGFYGEQYQTSGDHRTDAEPAESADWRRDYEQADRTVRDEVRDDRETLSNAANQMADEARDYVDSAAEQAQQSADSVRQELRDRWQDGARELGESLDRGAQRVVQGVLPDDASSADSPQYPQSAADHSSADESAAGDLSPLPGSEPRDTRSADATLPTSLPARRPEAWRPGSTREYPASRSEQGRYTPSNSVDQGEVAPAGYGVGPEARSSRLAPSYR